MHRFFIAASFLDGNFVRFPEAVSHQITHVLRLSEGAEVEAEVADGTVKLCIDGDKSGLLIGRKGRTLDALQFIVTKIVSKNLDRKVHLIIDSENYRRRRKDYLIQMALDMGEKARKSKKPMITGLLNPHDRRIVHIALKDQQQLTTTSRGEGMLKKVVIIPNK